MESKTKLLAVKLSVLSDRWAQDLKAASNEMSSFGKKMTSIGSKLSVLSSVPIAGLGAAAVNASMDFDRAMNLMASRVDVTASEFQKLREEAIKLGADTTFSASQAASAIAELGAAGLSATQISESMVGVLSLAAGGQLELGRAAEVAVSTMGQFGIAASESSRVADVLVATANAGTLSVDDLAESFKDVGPAANALGMSIEETSAAIALLSDAGIKAGPAGTALKAGLLRLVDPPKAAAEALIQLGVATKDTQGKMLPFEVIIKQLADKNASVSQLARIVGVEAVSAFAALQGKVKNNAGVFGEYLTKVSRVGAAQAAANTALKGLDGNLNAMTGSIETFAIRVGDILNPYARIAVDAVTSLANTASGLAQSFGQLPAPVQTFTVVLGGLLAVAGPLALGIGAASLAIGTIGLATAGTVAALAAGTAALVAFFGSTETGRSLLAALDSALTTTANYVAIFADTLIAIGPQVVAGIDQALTATAEGVAGMADYLIQFGSTVYNEVAEGFGCVRFSRS